MQKEWIIEVDKDAIKLVRSVARSTFRVLVRRSPVHAGPYVKSHRIGISKTGAGRGISKGHEKVNRIQVPKVSRATALAIKKEAIAKRISYISKAMPGDMITISNSIPYADQVEYIGWQTAPARHVYKMTVLEVGIHTAGRNATEILF